EVDCEFAFAKSSDGETIEEIQALLEESVKDGCEGLMVKTLTGEASFYEPSRRSVNWLKLKKDYLAGIGDSLDLVVVGGYYGKGKRTNVYGAFLLACYDPDAEEFQTICKIGTGFSEEALAAHYAQLKPFELNKPRGNLKIGGAKPDIWFDPKVVWEVLTADLSLSPVYEAARGLVDERGISLRFPRFIRVRDDKSADDATEPSQIAEMYERQSLAQNGPGKKKKGGAEDDFWFRKIFKETGHAVRGLLQSRSLVSSSSSSAHPTETHGSTPIPTAPATAGLPKIPIDQLPQPADDVGQGPMSLATQPPVPTPTAPGPSVTYVTGPSRLPSLHQNRPAGYHLPYVAPAHPVQGVPSQNPSADLVAVPTFEPRQSVSTPPGDLRTKDIASAVLKTPFDALKKTMSVIPTFNSVADVLSDCMENVPVAAKNHKDYEDLVNKIEASRMELGEHLSKFNPAQMTKGVANVIEQLNHLVKHIIEKQKRTKARAYVDAEQDIDDLIQCYRKVEELFRQLQSEAVLNVWRITSENWSMTNETLVVSLSLSELYGYGL
ncbi:hypothetical protein FRC07_003306, partial [Ceratobasidium sp. 392]